MLIGAIIVVCGSLLGLSFLLPRRSHGPQKGVDKTLSVPQRGASNAPGKLGEWLSKPFSKSRKATNKSASKGRQARGKLPL